MKKSFIITSILIMLGNLVSIASTNHVPITFSKNNKNNSGNLPDRAPIRNLPIEVTFDDENGIVEVVSYDTSLDGEVSIYDSTGSCIDYSPVINSTICLPQSISYPVTIYIESDTWIATGILNL